MTAMSLRWRIAYLVDKLPGQCWAELTEWALHSHEADPGTWWYHLLRRVPLRPQTAGCRDDRDAAGACYCGRLITAECRVALERRAECPVTAPRTAASAAEMIARRFHDARWRLCVTAYDRRQEWRVLDDGSKQLLIDTFRELLGPGGCLDVRYPGVSPFTYLKARAESAEAALRRVEELTRVAGDGGVVTAWSLRRALDHVLTEDDDR